MHLVALNADATDTAPLPGGPCLQKQHVLSRRSCTVGQHVLGSNVKSDRRFHPLLHLSASLHKQRRPQGSSCWWFQGGVAVPREPCSAVAGGCQVQHWPVRLGHQWRLYFPHPPSKEGESDLCAASRMCSISRSAIPSSQLIV